MDAVSSARLAAAATALVIGLAGVRVAGADWPLSRHDPARTGATTGQSNLRTPAPYWRYYLGGSIGPGVAEPITVAGGGPGQAFVTGGRLSVTRADGTPLWASANLAMTALIGTGDLDGDGTLELVTQSIDQVFVFAALDGALRWAEPVGEMGTINGVRLGDVDGDGRPEIFIQECMCCEVRSGETGVAWSFAAGFANPRRVWRLPYAYCSGYRAMLIDDFTGDGTPDVSLANNDDIKILDGATAQIRASSPDLGQWAAIAHCEPHDIVAGGGKELICALSSSLAIPGQGHRVFALGYRTNPARLDVLWSTNIGDVDTEFVLGAGWIQDLDGDGTLEVAASGVRSDGKLITGILDAATGETLASIPEMGHVGVVPVSPALRIYVTSAEQQLVGWRFDRAASPRLTEAWRLRDRRIVPRREATLAAAREQYLRVLHADVDGDGDQDLITAGGPRATLHLGDGSGGFIAAPAGALATGGLLADASALAAGDLDGDGHADLVVGQLGAPPRVFLGDASGAGVLAPAPAVLPPVPLDVRALAIADLDRDGDADLLITVAAGSARLYVNRGGLLEHQGFVRLPDAPAGTAAAVGDWDGDCQADLVVAGGTTMLLRGGADGVFAREAELAGAAAAVLADVDDDGDPDLVTSSAAEIAWYRR
jgi:hypothetical protein